MWSAVELWFQTPWPKAVLFHELDLRRELFHRKTKADFGPPPLQCELDTNRGSGEEIEKARAENIKHQTVPSLPSPSRNTPWVTRPWHRLSSGSNLTRPSLDLIPISSLCTTSRLTPIQFCLPGSEFIRFSTWVRLEVIHFHFINLIQFCSVDSEPNWFTPQSAWFSYIWWIRII